MWQRVLVAALPALLTLHRFKNGFVFDDVFVIVRGTYIHDGHNLANVLFERTMAASSLEAAAGRPAMDTYRPVSVASFFIDAALSGRAPWAYHLTNTILHAAVCVLLLELLRRLFPVHRGLWLLALCFGLAPWPAEAHVFINGRSDLLAAAFGIGAILAQERALRGRYPMTLLAAGLAFLSLLSKEITVFLLPFVVLVPSAEPVGLRRRALATLPLVVAFGAYMLLRERALQGFRTHVDGSQLVQALKNLPLLLLDGGLRSLVPSPYALRSMRDDYAGLPALAVPLAGAALAVATGLLGVYARRQRVLLWSLGLAVATLAPAAMISTVLWPGFGRYLYVPAVGLHIAVACLLGLSAAAGPRVRAWSSWAPAALAAINAVILADMTTSFRNEETLYRRAIERAPEQAWTYGFLGLSRKRSGDCQSAVPLLNRAATAEPGDPRYAVQLGRCLIEIGARDAARDLARRGIERFQGTRAESGFLMVQFLALPERDPSAAAPLLRRCLAVDPARTDCAEALQMVEAEMKPM